MSPLAKFRRWRRARRVSHAGEIDGPLREFVYLDETSLSSLLASQVGAPASEITHGDASTLLSEAVLTGGANLPVAKLESTARFQVSNTQSRQIVRKVIAQSKFKEFYDLNRKRLKLRPLDVQNQAAQASDHGTGSPVRANDLLRGDLVEIEVDLDAEAMFTLATALSSIIDLVDGETGLLSNSQMAELYQYRPITTVLDRLLSGLVPLHGVVKDVVATHQNGAEWIVPIATVVETNDPNTATRQLNFVGVAQQDLFWKDLRRVLFDQSQYRVIGRVNRRGLHDTWTPVKLASIFNRFSPDFETIVNGMSAELQREMDLGETLPPALHEPTPAERALERFVTELCAHLRMPAPWDLLRSRGLLAARTDEPLTVERLRALSSPIVEMIVGNGVEDKVLSDLRARALLAPPQPVFPPPTAVPSNVPAATAHGPRLLDIEIIAIYW